MPIQQFPLIASPPLLLMSTGQSDHPCWFNARQMVTKIGAMSVSKQARVRMWVDPTRDDWESPGLPTDISREIRRIYEVSVIKMGRDFSKPYNRASNNSRIDSKR